MNFKKSVGSLILAGVMTMSVADVIYAEDISITLDEEKVVCTVPARIENGRTMVPMRAIFEAFGMDVEWNNEEKSVSAQKGETVVKMTVGEKMISVNGVEKEIDVAPYIASDTTLVPVRAISESLDATVSWNDEKRRVEIVTKEYEENKDKWKENVGEIDLEKMSVTGEGASFEENVLKITKGGDFTLSGQNDNLMVHVDTNEKVKIRLSGVKITNPNGPAIFFENAKKAFITITKGTENFLSDGEEYSVDAKATVFSNDDIEIKGEGTLTVTSISKHALASDDDIKIEEGNLILISEKKDGIHTNNTFKMTGGNVDITSYGDGIQSEEDIVISGGEINIKTNGVVEDNNGKFGFGEHGFGPNRGEHRKPDNQNGGFNPMEKRDEQRGDMTPFEFSGREDFANKGEMPAPPEMNGEMGDMKPPMGENMTPLEMPDGFKEFENEAQTEDESVATKGIKAETAIEISDGKITVDSVDHAVHSAGVINISGGELTLTSQKGKGISAHGDMVISNGVIDVLKSTEGIESKANLAITGGEISVVASDDGINTGGTSGRDVVERGDKERDTGHDLTISGGTIYVNAQGDGIDSNGKIVITGGNIVVEGPTNNGNGALDSGGFIRVDGGELLALGASGMAEVPDGESEQSAFSLVTEKTIASGERIVITDKNGDKLVDYTTTKTGNSIVYSSKALKVGETYTVTIGDMKYEIEMTKLVTTSGKSNFGGFGGFGGGRGPR